MKRFSHPKHGYTHAMTPNDEPALIAAGWSAEEAQKAAPESEGESLVSDVDELEPLRVELSARGVVVDRRWKEARLRAEIEKASA